MSKGKKQSRKRGENCGARPVNIIELVDEKIAVVKLTAEDILAMARIVDRAALSAAGMGEK